MEIKQWLSKNLALFAWSVSGFVVLLGLLHWAQWLDWQFSELNLYRLFPLFGLLAFSLMWSHYVTFAARVYSGQERGITKTYSRYTGYAVLGFLLLHPGLLAWHIYTDGYGLPPASFQEYVGGALYGFLLLGTISFMIFMLYELHRWFARKSWWKWIVGLNHVAMLLIVVHAIKLGGSLMGGWFQITFVGYAVVLVLIYLYLWDRKQLI